MLKVLASILVVEISFSVTEILGNDVYNIEWIGGPYNWPCEATKSIFKRTGKFIAKNVIATRGVIYKDEAFLTLPR